MRWVIRFTAFLLSLGLGTSLWHATSRTGAVLAHLAQKAQTQSIIRKSLPVLSAGIQTEASGVARKETRSFTFAPVYLEPVDGYANAETIVLRESPEAGAPVVERLKTGSYDIAQVLGATRDFLRVRFSANDGTSYGAAERGRDFEGWTTWDSVTPDMSAIVLDAETGRVVARLPFKQTFDQMVGFSPDGLRAVFHSPGEDGQGLIYEVWTGDYTPARVLRLVEGYLDSVFYGANDGQLYATVRARSAESGKLTLVRINDYGKAENLMEFERAKVGFVISPDARTGFAIHETDGADYEVEISVVDLEALSIRHSFKLLGDSYSYLRPHNFVFNRDGSELYVRMSEQQDAIAVIDTGTGLLARALPGGLASYGWAGFGRGDLVGDSLLVSVVDKEHAEEFHTAPDRVWVSSAGRAPAQKGVEFAIEAKGERFAVNAEGTKLFRLNGQNRIHKIVPIRRPEVFKGARMGNDLSVFGLSASPDGKRIIMFVGLEQGC